MATWRIRFPKRRRRGYDRGPRVLRPPIHWAAAARHARGDDALLFQASAGGARGCSAVGDDRSEGPRAKVLRHIGGDGARIVDIAVGVPERP